LAIGLDREFAGHPQRFDQPLGNAGAVVITRWMMFVIVLLQAGYAALVDIGIAGDEFQRRDIVSMRAVLVTTTVSPRLSRVAILGVGDAKQHAT